VCCPSIISKSSPKLTWFQPLSLHDHGLQVHHPSRMIMDSKLIQSQAPNESPNSLDYRLQVHTIMASKCISILAQSWSQSVSPSSLHHGVHMYVQLLLITTSRCLSKLPQSWSWSISLSPLDCHFQAHHELLLSTAFCQSRCTMCRKAVLGSNMDK